MGAAHASEGALQYQLEVQDIIEEIEHSLKGEVLILEKSTGRLEWLKTEFSKRLINEKGIASILTILKSRLTKIFVLSYLDQEAIEEMTINIGKNIIDDLYYNWEEYEIEDDAAASHVLALVTDTVYATLCKSKGGTYLKYLRSVQTIQDVNTQHGLQSQNVQKSDGGILKKIFGKRR